MTERPIRIVSWNMNSCFRKRQREASWSYLQSLDADIALLQEVAPLPEGMNGAWHEVVRRWGTAVVAREGHGFREVPSVPVGGDEAIPRGHFERTHPGAWVAAEVDMGGRGRLMAVSVYGVLNTLGNGIAYATATVQRTLSDLTPVLDVARSKADVVMAGDFNISPQIPAPDTAAHVAVLDRITAFGLVDCLGATHGQLVQTYRHQNRAGGKPWQLDWVFASPKLKLLSCRPVDTEEAWALSDHCPVVAELELA